MGNLTETNINGTLGSNQKKFEIFGVEFINESGGRAGVRLRNSSDR
jgi:hypothetical protein